MGAAKGNNYASRYSPQEIEKLSKELVEWAKNSKSIHFASFCYDHNLSLKQLHEMLEHYPILDEGYEKARALIASKIVDLSFYTKDVNAYVGLQYLPVYDKQYKASKKEEQASNDLTITIKDYKAPESKEPKKSKGK